MGSCLEVVDSSFDDNMHVLLNTMNEFMEKKSSIGRDFLQADSEPMNVYIWDMDETLILLKSLLDGTYARTFNGMKDLRKGIEIGKRWENHILQVCDELFFYEEIENYNEPYLNSLIRFDDGRDLSNYDFTIDGFGTPFDFISKRKLAYRHRNIGEKYAQGLHKALDRETIETWNDLYSLTDSYTDGWLSSGRTLLNQALGSDNILKNGSLSEVISDCITTRCKSVNILVTSGSLIPSLVKCLLYRLDDVILAHHVYSSWEAGKLQCFSWIKERFTGPNVRFCVIGDGMEECKAAETMMWPFVKVDLQPTVSSHRFPDLSLKMIQSYIKVAYGLCDYSATDKDDEE